MRGEGKGCGVGGWEGAGLVEFLSKGNFDPVRIYFNGDGMSCVSICRQENCSLVELTDMVVEVLEGINLKPGTLILMGSTTHLHRVGVSMYAGDWATCVERLEQKWGGVHICPLIPLLFCESPPELARELTESAVWLVEMYKGSPKCLGDTWSSLVGILSSAATGGEGSGRTVYTIPLPSSLSTNCSWREHKFIINSPRGVALPSMDDNTIDGLLRVLVTTLNQALMTGLNPETLLSMENENREDAKETTSHLVLIRASHLRRTIPHLRRLGYDLTDVTKPGRMVSVAAVGEVLNQLRGTTVLVNTAVVIDMLGNSSSWWEQEDGALATAVKHWSEYHMLGVVTCATMKLSKS